MFNNNEPQKNSISGKRNILLRMPKMQNTPAAHRKLRKQPEAALTTPTAKAGKSEKMYKCSECKIAMEPKGAASDDGMTRVYQCPKCKNVELHTLECFDMLRLTYP